MRRTLPFLLLLAWTLPSQAQRFLRPADTLTQMTTTLNPSDPNTNIFVGSVGSWYQWIRGNTDSEDGTNTLASVFAGAPTGRFKKVSMAGGTVVVPQSVTNFTVVVVDNVAQLKSLSTTNGIGLVLLRGYFDPGDEGGGSVYLDTQNALVPDDGTVFSPNNGPYFWARFIPETFTGVKVAWFGRITNSTIDAAQAFATNRGGRNVVITGTNNLVTPPIRLLSNNTLAFETGANLIGNNTSNLIEIVGQSNVAIVGATLIGAVTNVWILNSTNVRIRDSLMVDASGAGIGMAGNSSIDGLELTGNQFKNVGAKYGNLDPLTITNLHVRDESLAVFNGKFGVGAVPGSSFVDIRPILTNGAATAMTIQPNKTNLTANQTVAVLRVVGGALLGETNRYNTVYGAVVSAGGNSTNLAFSQIQRGTIALSAVSGSSTPSEGVATGLEGVATGAPTNKVGISGYVINTGTPGRRSIAVQGRNEVDVTASSTGTNIAGAFFFYNLTNAPTDFPNPVTTVLLADNLDTGKDLLLLRTNQTEVFKVDGDGRAILRGATQILTGSGIPEGAVTAPVGSTFHRTDGGASTTLYIKESGAGNTGWVAAGSGGGGGLADPGGNGVVVRTALNTTVNRTLTGTANQITVVNGDGVSGNQTLSHPTDLIHPGNVTITNAATGTKTLVLNGPSGATVNQLEINTGGTNWAAFSNLGQLIFPRDGTFSLPQLRFDGAALDVVIYADSQPNLVLRDSTSGAFHVFDPRTGAANRKQYMSSDFAFGWSSTAGATSGTFDTQLYRDAADTTAQRRAANAQTHRLYGTFTDASNYERMALTTTTGTGVAVVAETAGTGGDNLDLALTPAGTGDVRINKALVALGGGAAPTVGTIGGSGPATAAQNSWLQLKDSSGAVMWVPVWK